MIAEKLRDLASFSILIAADVVESVAVPSPARSEEKSLPHAFHNWGAITISTRLELEPSSSLFVAFRAFREQIVLTQTATAPGPAWSERGQSCDEFKRDQGTHYLGLVMSSSNAPPNSSIYVALASRLPLMSFSSKAYRRKKAKSASFI